MKNPHDIIRRPVLTEKAYTCIADKRYIFEVDVHAPKTEIKQAVEAVFAADGVKVDSVHTMNRQGKARRTRFGTGKRKDTKRAIVSVAAGQSIDIFSSQA